MGYSDRGCNGFIFIPAVEYVTRTKLFLWYPGVISDSVISGVQARDIKILCIESNKYLSEYLKSKTFYCVSSQLAYERCSIPAEDLHAV